MFNLDYFPNTQFVPDHSFYQNNSFGMSTMEDNVPLGNFLFDKDDTPSPTWSSEYNRTEQDEIDVDNFFNGTDMLKALYNSPVVGETTDAVTDIMMHSSYWLQTGTHDLISVPPFEPEEQNPYPRLDAVVPSLGTPRVQEISVCGLTTEDVGCLSPPGQEVQAPTTDVIAKKEEPTMKAGKRRYTRRVVKKPRKSKIQQRRSNRTIHLWEFLKDLLNSGTSTKFIQWINKKDGTFRLVNSSAVARLWGEKKNRHNMTYEKMSRALRYYYEKQILERVPNARLIYKFGVKSMSFSDSSEDNCSDCSEQ